MDNNVVNIFNFDGNSVVNPNVVSSEEQYSQFVPAQNFQSFLSRSSHEIASEPNLQFQPPESSNTIIQSSFDPSAEFLQNFQPLSSSPNESNLHSQDLLESLPSCSESGEHFQSLLNSDINFEDDMLPNLESSFKISVKKSTNIVPDVDLQPLSPIQKPNSNTEHSQPSSKSIQEPIPQNQPTEQEAPDLRYYVGLKAVQDFEHLMKLFPNEGPPGIHGILIMSNYDVKKAEEYLKYVTEYRKKKDENGHNDDLRMEEEIDVHEQSSEEENVEVTGVTINDVEITPIPQTSRRQSTNDKSDNEKEKITGKRMRKARKRLNLNEVDKPEEAKKGKGKCIAKAKQNENDSNSEAAAEEIVKLVPFKRNGTSGGKYRTVPQVTTLKEVYRSRNSQFFQISK